MLTTQKKTEYTLDLTPKIYQDFRDGIQSARKNGEEAIAILLCRREEISSGQMRFIAKYCIVPTPDCYEYQSRTGLTLKQEFNVFVLKEYIDKQELDVVHIHTHPGKHQPYFSAIDDEHEARYARFLTDTFSYQPRLISGVFDESLELSTFRVWDRDGKSTSEVNFSHNWFNLTTEKDSTTELEAMFSRQEVFGRGVQQKLGELSIALIGCGGIGSIVVEQLARLGVKNWTLVDPDSIEEVNLNRLPGATKRMVEGGWSKVKYAKKLIKQVYPTGSYVRAIAESIESEAARREIAKADLIVVATDNHLSRQIAQEIALEAMRPLVCLGTHIEMLPNNTPRMYCRVTVPPLGGGWCLMCANVISTQRAALESAPPQISEAMVQKGYISGIADPAVFWLNGICASKGVGVIHGLVSGFLDIPYGIDWIYDFPNGNWLKTDVSYLTNSNCFFCAD